MSSLTTACWPVTFTGSVVTSKSARTDTASTAKKAIVITIFIKSIVISGGHAAADTQRLIGQLIARIVEDITTVITNI
jgi:hypothetical protein